LKRENIIIWVGLFLLIGVWIGGKFGQSVAERGKMDEFFNYLQDEYVEDLDLDSLQNQAMDYILSSLDPHSTFIPVEQGAAMAERMEGGFSGIGVEFAIKKDTLVFISVMQSGPASKAGVQSGDRVFTIDGDTVVGNGLNNELVTSKIKGKRGTKVQLGLKRKGELRTIEVMRDIVPIESVIHLDTEDGIGYLKVDRFSETTHDEFLGHLEQLSAGGMEELIVDLRDNPGGYLHEAVAMADEFLGEGKLIVTTRYRNGSVKNAEAKSGNRYESMPVHIIIDENSASASEVFTGALQDHDRATVYGKTSFGKGLVQEDKLLGDGSKVRLTVAYYFTPSGRSIQKPYRENQVFNEGVFLSDTGRILYAQGGIEPDVELQNDSASYFWTFSFGTIDAYSFEFVDSTRDSYQYVSISEFLSKFKVADTVLSSFLEFGGYGLSLEDLGQSDRKELELLLKAGIAKNLWGFDAYRKVLLLTDPIIEKVKDQIQTKQ
jgi:carboxyl-terminal processing protease